MRRICALVALTLAVPLARANIASASLPWSGTVNAVSIVGAEGRAEVVVAINGQVRVSDFTIADPNRIVLDISPASLSGAPALYDNIVRGGVRNVRFAQYDQNVVRVVLEMATLPDYSITTPPGEIRISFPVSDASFPSWNSAPDGDAVSATPRTLAAATGMAQAQQALMSASYDSTPIREVIAGFSAYSGRTILPSKEVTGFISGEIINQPWDVGLRALLDANGFAMIEEPSGIIKVDTYQNIIGRQQTEALGKQTIRLNYAKAVSLAPTLRSLLYRDCQPFQAGAAQQTSQAQTGSQIGEPSVPPGCVVRGMIVADSNTNSLVITEVSSNMDSMMDFIRQLDFRTPQVSISARIMLVNRTSIEDIGISYDIGQADQFFNTKIQRTDPSTVTPIDLNGDGVPDALGGGTPFDANSNIVSLGGNALSAISNASTQVLNPALQLIYATAVGKFDLNVFLDALQETRLADVIAVPSVVTMDNQEAVLFVGEETPIRTVQPQQGNTAVVQTIIQFKETGIELRVRPHVTNNRQVSMEIFARRGNAEPGSSDIGLIFNRQEVTSRVLVADGETAVTAGLTVTQVSQSRIGIPILVDLPIIGKLFGQTTTREEKRDLLILITPHIVDEGQAGGPGGQG